MLLESAVTRVETLSASTDSATIWCVVIMMAESGVACMSADSAALWSVVMDGAESVEATLSAVNNHWTGLPDWTTGLDYWTDQFYHKIHTCGVKNPCTFCPLNRVLEVPPMQTQGCMMII